MLTRLEIINLQHNGTIPVRSPIINLSLYYTTLSTCIAGTQFPRPNSTILNKIATETSGSAYAINSPEFLSLYIQTTPI